MKKQNIKYSLFITAIILMTSCSKEQKKFYPQAIPQNWYDSDTQSSKDPNSSEENENFEGTDALNNSIDHLLTADSEALEEGDEDVQSMVSSFQEPLSPMVVDTNESKKSKPKDWVPWRAEYFMTDLSLTGSGLIGALTFKGTSTVRAYWRKQGPKVEQPHSVIDPESALAQEELGNAEPMVQVTETSSSEEMVKQLEPAIHAAVATGKIEDTPVLRKNLLQTAKEFQFIATSIPGTADDLPWWVSRFRLDFTVDAAGRVEPVGMVGGEVRFRFEWHRIRKIGTVSSKNMVSLSERQQKIRKSLMEFVMMTADDLDHAFENHNKLGFKAHQVRMGIGISVKGNIGVVKGSAGVVGQIYFTRAVERPKVNPIPKKEKMMALALEESPVLVIERNPSQAHLKLAAQNSMFVETSTSGEEENTFEEAIYRMDRKKFRKGLQKAAKISAFFAKRATKAHFKSWKIYELRTAFDASISGGLDLVTIVGSTTAQISMFNENF